MNQDPVVSVLDNYVWTMWRRRSKVGAARSKGGPLNQYMDVGIGEVDGWLGHDVVFPLERLAARQRVAGVSGGVAEIGVHHGQLFILLALFTAAPERSVGIDLFEDQRLNVDGSGRGDRAILESNMARHGVAADRVDLVTMNSMDLTSKLVMDTAGGPVRMFSVDGGHTPELTVNDLEVAEQSIAHGGIIVLDDAFSPMWPGVIQGLFRWFESGERDVVPFAQLGNKTLFTSPDLAGQYQDVLEVFRGQVNHRDDHLFGHPIVILKA